MIYIHEIVWNQSLYFILYSKKGREMNKKKYIEINFEDEQFHDEDDEYHDHYHAENNDNFHHHVI